MPPSTYRRKTQSQPSAEEMETTYQADLHWDLPLSTAASAAHSQPHQQVMIDNAGYGLFEPVAEDSGNSNFSAILSGQPAPQSQQQQVSGDFTPGAGAGTNEWYQQQNNTVYSDYSGLSAAQLSSPARSTPSQQSFSFPANSNPNTFDSSTGFHQLYYPDRHLPRFDFPGSTEQYASSAPPTDMHYMSSPEQQYHRTQPIFSATSQAPLLGRQNITTGQSAPLTIVSPIKITSQESAGFNTGWGTVDTNVIAPDGSGSVGLRRLPGACRNCKRLKMKCIYEDGADICQRCKQTGKSESCVVECRRRGPALNKRELLMREIASRDQLIDSLLRQLHNPAMSTPINWPPTVPVPQQPTNTDRPLEQDVVAWIESTRQYRPPMLTGSIDARNNQGHTHLVSEPITSSTNVHPDDNAVSFGDNDSKVKDKGVSRLLVPAELRQDSAEIDDQLHLIDGTTAVGPIAKLSLGLDQRGSDAGMTGDAKEENEWVQVGNLTSFQTGSSANPEWRPVISERQISPEILTGGIIKPNEVVKVLFEELNVSGSKHENESARDGDGSYDGWVWVADDWE